MELDKIAYITLACLTGLIIILVIAFGTYGSNISKDPSFIMFFKWYIFLFVFNLFNILVTLIFHYIMADIPGEKGLKGFTGDRGLPGESSKCFCTDGIKLSNQIIKDIDLNKNIHTRDVMGPNKINRIGTIIYDGTKTDALTIDHQNAIQQLNKQVAAEAVVDAAAEAVVDAAAAAADAAEPAAVAAEAAYEEATEHSKAIATKLRQADTAELGLDAIELILSATSYAKLILELDLDYTAVEEVVTVEALEAAEQQFRESVPFGGNEKTVLYVASLRILRYLVVKVSSDAADAAAARNNS